MDTSETDSVSFYESAYLIECKKALQQELGLDVKEDTPLIGMVGRLSNQKGLDLVDYVITDMKSGAMMKVADKADRYDRSYRTPFPVEEVVEEAAEEEVPENNEPLIPQMELFEEMMIGIYYDDTGIWEVKDNTEKEN